MIENLKELFANKRVRTSWDEERQDWWFSVVDIVAVFTDSKNPRRYWCDLKRKAKAQGSQLYDEIVQLKLKSDDGKFYMTDVANTKQIRQIIESIPSAKAELFMTKK